MTKEETDALFERLNGAIPTLHHYSTSDREQVEWRAKREGFRQAMGVLEPAIMVDADYQGKWRTVHRCIGETLYRIREDRNV